MKIKKLKVTLFMLVLTITTMAQDVNFRAVLPTDSPQDANQGILPYPITQVKLPNGLNVVTIPYDSPGIAAFYIVMRVGSRDEIEKGKSGFAHFFEHMMFRGTEKYPSEKYSDILKSTGASANANTSLDRTVYHMTGNAAMLDKMFEIEADRFMNLKYSLQQFKTEAGAVKGEYTKNYSSPYAQLNEKISDVAFSTHTYKHTTMGFFQDVVDMPNQYDYSLDFFNRFYRPEYATIIVVGDVTPIQVKELAKKYFMDWKKGDFESVIPEEPEQTAVRFTHIQVADFPPLVALEFKGPPYLDNQIDMAAVDVLNAILFSEKSELYNKLVVKEQKLRSLEGSANSTRDPYLIEIQASLVKQADMQYVKDEIMKAIDMMKTKPVEQRYIDEAKNKMRYSFAMNIDSPSKIAEAVASFTWITGDPESLNNCYLNYAKVNAADIMMVANKFYVSNHLTVGTISADATTPIK